MSAGVRPAADRDLPRVAQLTQKTNQFNLSLVRRSLDEIQALRSSRSILVLDATDRFGDYGIVGAAIVDLSPEGLALDTFLISCRALGRGLEDAFLFAVIDLGRASGCPRVVAPFRQGARNHQVRDFFQRSGFADDDGVMTLPLRSAPLAPPKHIKLSVASLTSG